MFQEHEEETSFNELLPRSVSDGNLVRLVSSCTTKNTLLFLHGKFVDRASYFRAPSERFLLQNIDPRKSYGTCSRSISMLLSGF